MNHLAEQNNMLHDYSIDSSSEESIKDWNLVLDSIVDLYNRSPLGKRHDLFYVQLISLPNCWNDDNYCAKEKKDVHTLEELKKSAVLQQLGEQKILDSIKNLCQSFTQNTVRAQFLDRVGQPDQRYQRLLMRKR
jgi:hypothetical protein